MKRHTWVLVGILLAATVWRFTAGSQHPRSHTTQDVGTARETNHGPVFVERHDLSADEAKGGHTLERHVGRTDDQLKARLREERNISAASTYTDRASAEIAVGSALAAEKDRISDWLVRNGGHPNLVLDYDSPAPLGRTMHRADNTSQSCSHALIVLKYDSAQQYHVLTSYPECK